MDSFISSCERIFSKIKGRTFWIAAFWLLSHAGSLASEERNLLRKAINPEQLSQVLVLNQKWVTYPAYSDRAGWDKLTGSLKASLIQKGEKKLSYKWEVITISDYLDFERTGSRESTQAPFDANFYSLNNLVLAELAEGKGRFLDQIINGIWFHCEMANWALPNGLMATSARIPRRPMPDPNDQVVDLTSSDLGAFLAWTYYFFKAPMDKIHPAISGTLRANLQRRVLDPYMHRSDFWWQALDHKPANVNNWNSWCNSNVLTCYLLLENDPQKLAAAVARTMKSVDQYINYNHDDGGCEEGPSYWSHGPGKLYDYLTLLSRATGGKICIFDQPIIKNLGEYIVQSYIGNGWVVNFADASARKGSAPGMIYRYGKAVNSGSMQQFGAYLARGDQNYGYVNSAREFFRTLENLTTREELDKVESALPSAPFAWYPQTELCFLRNDVFFMAAKGGYNNESHNHNDVGTFSLYADTIPFFIDAGVGTYTRQTFGRERYTIWTMQSNYHNLPMINGAAQQFGAAYKSRNADFNAAAKKFSLDISGAYNNEASVKSWQRSYTLSDKGLTIEDAFDLTAIKEPTSVNFLVAAKPVIDKDGIVTLEKNNQKVELHYPKNSFNVFADTITLDDKRLSNVWGSEVYRVRLVVKKPQLKGKYTYMITKVAR